MLSNTNMSYYGGDRYPDVARERTRVNFHSRRPVTRKVGHNARVTVETGAIDRRKREEQEYDEARRVEQLRMREERLRIRARDERLGRPVVYYEPISRLQRRSSLPDQTYNDSPSLRPSAPPSESRPGTEVVEEVLIPAEDSEVYAEHLDFKIPKVDNRVHFSDDVAFIIPDSGSSGSNERPSAISKPKFTGQMTETVRSSSM